MTRNSRLLPALVTPLSLSQTTASPTMSASSEAALTYLRKIKPLDGWSIEKKPSLPTHLRLLRRNVPLTDNYFLDIHHDDVSGTVVGILTNNKNGVAQAQVLVDNKGVPTGKKINLVSVSTWKPGQKAATTSSSFASRSASISNESSSTASAALSDEQNQQLLTYGAYVLGGLVVLRALLQTMFLVYILAFPLAYLYLVSTCPSQESFDTKKELKRVMRGHHLPEDHPDKPKGFLSETLARIGATLSTELATGLGYEVTMVSMAGAALVTSVLVPAVKMEFYWVGAAGKWFYVYSREIPNTKSD